MAKIKHQTEKKKLQASSLVEVLVALSLASIVFTIGTTIWLQLNGRNASYRQIEMRMRARKLIDAAIETQEVSNQVFNYNGIGYERLIQPVNSKTGVFKITVKAFSKKNEPFFQRAKIVRYEAS